jgi:MFS superfamily sulfate permease-like transporter
MPTNKSILSNLKTDLPAGIVVFLVALPLCLGIALASGAPFFSGMIAGIVGGLVVASISNSQLSVSGPAAGLAAIVLVSIQQLGSFNIFLLAVVLAGVIQVVLGFLKAGSISNYFPSNVIKGNADSYWYFNNFKTNSSCVWL